jgi:hypothetical protein
MVTSSLNKIYTVQLGNRVEVEGSTARFCTRTGFKDDVNGFSSTSNICFVPSITQKYLSCTSL